MGREINTDEFLKLADEMECRGFGEPNLDNTLLIFQHENAYYFCQQKKMSHWD